MLPEFRGELIVQMHHIKNVTVIMRMYCVSFRLPGGGGKEEEREEGEGEGEGGSNGGKKVKKE